MNAILSNITQKYTKRELTKTAMCETSLMIPKEQSESVYRRRPDNTMAKRKGTNNDLQNIHIKLKIE